MKPIHLVIIGALVGAGISAYFGFSGIMGHDAYIAKTAFWVFMVLYIILFITAYFKKP